MSYPIPTNDVPDWDPPDADVVEPTSGEKATGWQPLDIPPAEVFNWFWRNGSRWLRHLRDVAARYTALYAAGDDSDLTDASTFILNEDEGGFAPGSQIASLGTTTTPSGIAVTDRHVITAHNGANLRVIDIDTSTIVDIVLPGSGTTGVVRTDGQITAIARGSDVHIYNTADADPNNWSFVATLGHGAIVHDVAIDFRHVYLVGGAGTGTHYARAFTHAGAAVWDYDHGGILYHCCTDAVYVFVGGAVSTHPSNSTMRALDCIDGSDAANEGGTAANTTIGAWDASNATFPTTSGGAMACTRHRLFVADTASGLQVRSKGDGIADHTHTLAGVDALAVDHEFCFVTTGAQIRGFDVSTGVCSWTRNYTGGNITQMATSGARLYLARGAANDILRAARGNRPGLWLKGSPDFATPRAEFTPFRSM